MDDLRKRKNPLTGDIYRYGDTRPEDNKIFQCYILSHIKMNGMYSERWMSPDIKEKTDRGIRQRNRKRREKQRTESYAWVKQYKESHPCTDCRGFFQACQMQFDHLPGHEKVANISKLVGKRSLDAIKEEIAKCELVCANCHALRTFNRLQNVVHLKTV